ncbi:hypothetical protein EV360DRAFT_91097 [Lentinula raphanica]|nr:hypothetical protein EV360DRAFT_91097 [Lentinula raphanica]
MPARKNRATPDAFPTDLDLFGTDSGGHGVGGASQQSSGGGESPPRMSPHSTRVRLEPGLEGGGATFPRGRGPLLPASPASTGELSCPVCVAFVTRFVALDHPTQDVGWCVLVFSAFAAGRVVPGFCLGLVVPGVLGTSGAQFVRDGWCPVCLGRVVPLVLFPLGRLVPGCCVVSPLGLLVPACSDASSDLSEWGGVEGEFRVAASPALEPPFQLRPALSREPQFTTSAPQSRRDQVEQFRSDSRSQRRREHGDDGESPTHVKLPQPRLLVAPSPRQGTSLEDGGRDAVRYSDHTRRRSRSVEPMSVDPVFPGAGGGRSYANRTSYFLFVLSAYTKYLFNET